MCDRANSARNVCGKRRQKVNSKDFESRQKSEKAELEDKTRAWKMELMDDDTLVSKDGIYLNKLICLF